MSTRGNELAQKTMAAVFSKTDAEWRGIGKVKASGLEIRKEFVAFDARARFEPKAGISKEPKGCICGAVLKGIMTPTGCRLFGKSCTPEHPIGACMVSGEGTCAAYFKYGAKR